MAIRPEIALNVRAPDVGQIFNNALVAAQGFQGLKERRERAPIQNRLLEAQAESTEAGAAQAGQLNRIRSLAVFGNEIQGDLQSGNLEAIRAKTVQRISDLPNQGLPANDSTELLQILDDPNVGREEKLQSVSQLANAANQRAIQFGALKGPSGGASIRSSAPVVDPNTGQLSIPTFDPSTNTTQLLPVEGAIQQTPQQKLQAEIAAKTQIATTEAELQGQTAAVKAAVTKGSKIFDRVQPLSTAISNYDEAISAIDSGAQTGVVASLMPSFKKASIELDNVVKRLGLDVVGNTTFGALSESELKFALKAAIPDNLKPADLKNWLIAKRDAQRKVKARVEEAAAFLSEGTHTIKDWIEFDAANQLNAKNQAEAQPTQAAPAQAAQAAQVDTGGIQFLGFE